MEEKKRKSSLKKKRKMIVLSRDGHRCQYCGLTVQDGATLEVDHMKPLSKGGLDRMSNLITTCRECNRSKRDKNLELPIPAPTERRILNKDGSFTIILKGMTADDLARSLCGQAAPCLACGEEAMHRVVWRSPHLKARVGKNRSLIYPICDSCSNRLFVEGDDSVGNAIDDILVPQAEAAQHECMMAITPIREVGE